MSEAEETIHEALASVPTALARRLGAVEVDLRAGEEEIASRWRWGKNGVEVEVNPNEISPHDCALELLTCLGQALWNSASAEERRAWLKLLREEIEAEVEGEIDERALREKRAMLSSRVLAASPRRMRTGRRNTLQWYLPWWRYRAKSATVSMYERIVWSE